MIWAMAMIRQDETVSWTQLNENETTRRGKNQQRLIECSVFFGDVAAQILFHRCKVANLLHCLHDVFF